MASFLVGGVLGVLTYKAFGTLLLFGISAALLLFAGSHILALKTGTQRHAPPTINP